MTQTKANTKTRTIKRPRIFQDLLKVNKKQFDETYRDDNGKYNFQKIYDDYLARIEDREINLYYALPRAFELLKRAGFNPLRKYGNDQNFYDYVAQRSELLRPHIKRIKPDLSIFNSSKSKKLNQREYLKYVDTLIEDITKTSISSPKDFVKTFYREPYDVIMQRKFSRHMRLSIFMKIFVLPVEEYLVDKELSDSELGSIYEYLFDRIVSHYKVDVRFSFERGLINFALHAIIRHNMYPKFAKLLIERKTTLSKYLDYSIAIRERESNTMYVFNAYDIATILYVRPNMDNCSLNIRRYLYHRYTRYEKILLSYTKYLIVPYLTSAYYGNIKVLKNTDKLKKRYSVVPVTDAKEICKIFTSVKIQETKTGVISKILSKIKRIFI